MGNIGGDGWNVGRTREHSSLIVQLPAGNAIYSRA